MATLRFAIPAWLQEAEDYVSRELEGEVLAVSERGVKVRAHPVVRPTDHCLRCGHKIDNPVSLLAGYGPDCSAKLGIPRDFTEDEVAAIRAEVAKIEVEKWFPRAHITVLEGTIEEPATRAATLGLKIVKDRIHAATPFSAKDAIKEIPGRLWDKTARVWTFPVSPASARELLILGERLRLQVETDNSMKALVDLAGEQEAAAVHKTADELPPVPSKTDAWHHQAQAFWFSEKMTAAMLAMDMGTGKSKVAVDLVCHHRPARTLIICPKNVVGVWPREFARHGAIEVDVVAPRKGPRGGELDLPARAAEIQKALDTQGERPLVIVVNYEGAWQSVMGKMLLAQHWDLVILDESHRVKKPSGKASMFVASLYRRSDRRLCLTGTPMPHSPLDVYGQYRFLDPGIFGTSFANFRNHYAIMGGYGGHEVLGYQNQPELARRMYSIGFRVMADDVLDLPEVIRVYRSCDLDPITRRIYNDLDHDFYADVENGTITAANVLVRLLRLAQVTSGYAPLDDPDRDGHQILKRLGTEKEDLLNDTIEDIPPDEPIVVFCRFIPDLDAVERVATEQGRRYGELSGRRRDGLAPDATMAPDIDIIGVQIQAGGVGIDLTRARYCVYYSVGFSLGDFEQAEARVHRPGQERPVTYYHLLADDTVDVRVYQALRERKSVVEFVLSKTGTTKVDEVNAGADYTDENAFLVAAAMHDAVAMFMHEPQHDDWES